MERDRLGRSRDGLNAYDSLNGGWMGDVNGQVSGNAPSGEVAINLTKRVHIGQPPQRQTKK